MLHLHCVARQWAESCSSGFNVSTDLNSEERLGGFNRSSFSSSGCQVRRSSCSVASHCAGLLLGSSTLLAMSTDAARTVEELFYKKWKYRAIDPLEGPLQCLDVMIKVEQTLAKRVRSKFSSRMPPFMRLGSMLDVELMAGESKWRLAEANSKILDMRKGLSDFQRVLKTRSSHPGFQKKKLPELEFSFCTSKRVVLWLASVAGIDLGKDESLSCTMSGLTAASVEYANICSWVMDRDWYPDISFLQMLSSDWSKNRSQAKKLWIVTEVLYARKFIVRGRQGLFNGVMAQASIGAPGLTLGADAEVGLSCTDGRTLELTANRNKQFIVGYRTMRVEYNPDGSVKQFRKAEDTGLRGDDDDTYQLNLAEMGEDSFEVDEDRGNVLIPLLTPTEQELHDFRSLVADSGDSEAAFASSS